MASPHTLQQRARSHALQMRAGTKHFAAGRKKHGAHTGFFGGLAQMRFKRF
jgi:hypothetical protein